MKQKVMKVGHSLGITIPAYFVKTIGLKAGDLVQVKTQPEKGKVVYSFDSTHQLPLLPPLDKKRSEKK